MKTRMCVGGHKREAAVGVTRSRADLERVSAEANDVAVNRAADRRLLAPVDAQRAPIWLPSATFISQAPVTWSAWQCVSSVKQKLQPELADERGVAGVLLEDGIDEHRLARVLVGEQIAVRAGDLVEELAKEHVGPPRSHGLLPKGDEGALGEHRYGRTSPDRKPRGAQSRDMASMCSGALARGRALRSACHVTQLMPSRAWTASFVGVALLLVAARSEAYRPFDGTDADVAEPSEFELELGPVQYYRQGSQQFLIAPALVLNFGLFANTELVVDTQQSVAVGKQETGEPRVSLLGNDVLLKHVFREGTLQGKSGLSIAAEGGVLLPEIMESPGLALRSTSSRLINGRGVRFIGTNGWN